MILSLALGSMIGMLLGMTGSGGGILAVPALVAGFGWSMQQAAPVALIAVAGSAAVGALDGLRRKIARYRAAILMALAGMSFTPLGARAAHALPQQVLMAAFALVMLVVAVRMLRAGKGGDERSAEFGLLPAARIDPETGRFVWTRSTVLLLGAIGATTGFLTGLLGVGGGFVLVPLLRRFTNLTMPGVVATSLLVVALVGASGVLAGLSQGAPVELLPTTLFAAATAFGMIAGRAVGERLPSGRVQQVFSIVLLLVASAMLVRAATM